MRISLVEALWQGSHLSRIKNKPKVGRNHTMNNRNPKYLTWKNRSQNRLLRCNLKLTFLASRNYHHHLKWISHRLKTRLSWLWERRLRRTLAKEVRVKMSKKVVTIQVDINTRKGGTKGNMARKEARLVMTSKVIAMRIMVIWPREWVISNRLHSMTPKASSLTLKAISCHRWVTRASIPRHSWLSQVRTRDRSATTSVDIVLVVESEY